MNIELRNLKVFDSMSEETTACSADIYVDGKKVGYLQNSGKGEGMFPRGVDQPTLQRMATWAKSLPPVETSYGLLSMDLDFLLAMMVERDWTKQRAKKMFASRVCLINEKGEVFTSKPIAADLLAKVHSGAVAYPLKDGHRIMRSATEVCDALMAGV